MTSNRKSGKSRATGVHLLLFSLLFKLLALTGFVLWLGFDETGGGELFGIGRSLWETAHQWLSVAFTLFVIWHIVLNRHWIDKILGEPAPETAAEKWLGRLNAVILFFFAVSWISSWPAWITGSAMLLDSVHEYSGAGLFLFIALHMILQQRRRNRRKRLS